MIHRSVLSGLANKNKKTFLRKWSGTKSVLRVGESGKCTKKNFERPSKGLENLHSRPLKKI